MLVFRLQDGDSLLTSLCLLNYACSPRFETKHGKDIRKSYSSIDIGAQGGNVNHDIEFTNSRIAIPCVMNRC